MKKLFLLLVLGLPFFGFSQSYFISVDTVQNFTHDTSYSITESVCLNNINYINAQTTNLNFIFDFKNKTLTWQYGKGETKVNNILKVNLLENNSFDVWVKYNDGYVNYFLSKNNDSKNDYVFVRRKFEGDMIIGWFDPSVKLKKRP